MVRSKGEYEKLMQNRPHVVILGAGASMAAIEKGDKNGRPISCMKNFLKNIGIEYILEGIKLETESDNLEDIYSELDEKSKTNNDFQKKKLELEKAIFDYFDKFEIPDEPIIYDYLLLGLKENDLIASFNWDPFLIQAGNRLIEKGIISPEKLPRIVFLHGNIGVCYDRNKNRTYLSSHYDNRYEKSKLLYPIKRKDYTSDLIISESWKMLENYLHNAYVLTIFGYGAPNSDASAVELLKKAWGNLEKRNLEEIEIIDIANEEQLYERWKPFIFNNNYRCRKSFYDSMIFQCPRRTSCYLFDVTMKCLWGNLERGFKQNMSFTDLKSKINPLILDENENKNNLLDPYLGCVSLDDERLPDYWRDFDRSRCSNEKI